MIAKDEREASNLKGATIADDFLLYSIPVAIQSNTYIVIYSFQGGQKLQMARRPHLVLRFQSQR